MKNQQVVITQDDYKRKTNLSIQWNRWLLTPIGAWPNLRKSRIGKCYSLLISIICYSLIGFMLVSCSIFLMVEINNIYNKLKMVGPLSFFVMTIMKYYFLLFHENDIREGIERIEWDWKNVKHQEDRNIMITYANYGRKLAFICFFFMLCAFIFYFLIQPFGGGKIVDGNLTFIQLPFPISILIADVRDSPYNEIMLSIQILTGIVMNAIRSAICSVAAVFAIHACGQMQVLMNWLNHLVEGRSDMSKKIDDRIANIVIQHDRILKFLALTERALQQISFVEFLGCTANMCLLGYYLIVEWNPKELIVSFTYIAIIASITFNIFIFCYIGELVAEQTEKVGEVAYMIEWYRIRGKKKLCCVLIIAMSNSSIKFTAGNMVELSIYTFSDVVKTSVAFLNMLRALT
ncbi:odorant receptor 30 isoform X3 [Apis mellifera]|uniref:Odorant receptor n=1 Tax=Apis mellifera TaxID=7460 RepID=A0A7M7GY87_APIME|nr:odorant receptor 30 isoform X3 [Apis mellifera]|eukprot:XP_006565890.1 odorant receptor 30 isoform X3 [Apis mellifera]